MRSSVQTSSPVAKERSRILRRVPGRILSARTPRELRDLLPTILRGVFPDARFELYVTDADANLTPVAGGDTRNGDRQILASLRAHLLTRRDDLTEPHAFPALPELQRCSLMSAPLLDDAGTFIGLVVAEAAPGAPAYEAAELEVLEGFAALLSLALQRLGSDEPTARARRELDLKAACRIQRRLMSGTLPPNIGVTAHAEYQPALGVGGDFYSLKYLGDRRVSLAIGDVSGNGVSAALVMSRVAYDIERSLGAGEAPSAVLRKINGSLSDVESETFVTASCARLDTARRTLTVANAGHLPLVVRRANGEVFTCGGASGMPLGMVPCEYDEEELVLEPRDIVLLMTDGLLEALDHPSGHRGMEVLLGEIQAGPHDPRIISERIRASVERARKRYVLDDVTWVGLQLAA